MALSSISITAPSSAREGDRVSVSAKVTNTTATSYSFRVKLYAVRDIYAVPAPEELLGSWEVVIGGGLSKTYNGVFTMPAWDTTVVVMVYRFINYWDFDNYATKVVSLELVQVPIEWVPLAEVTISVSVPEIAVGWYELYSTPIQMSVPEIAVGWYELYSTPIQMSVPVPVPPIPPIPPEEEEFPWVPVALIGGGIVLVAATMAKPKTTKT